MANHRGRAPGAGAAPALVARRKAGFILLPSRVSPAAALAVVAAVASLVVAGCAAPAGPKESAPDFTIILYQGETELEATEIRMSDLRGAPVVLNFWAGLCPPCRAEMPEFQEFRDDFEGRVTLVGVDLGQFWNLGSKEDARKLLEELGVTYAAGYTDDDQVVQSYRVLGLPTTVFITANGELHKKWDGVLNLEKLSEIAGEMLAEDSG